ncbi:MAG TPA: mechanosensitive ion channel domain-containing protein [Saprospiraceae bacterium]|nr:mechanosensitive ion channel domain-containing protein [Saprospiraceae bacterium]
MKEFLDYQIFRYGGYGLQVHNILEVVLVVVIARVLMGLFAKGITKSTRFDAGAKYSIRQLVNYTLIVISILLIVNLLGIDLSVVFVGSAALLVGIGFGLQHLFNDFVSGIIILFDKTVKVNDVIEVDGIVCRVQEIKLRTTTVITREDKCILIPNSVITGGKVVNWTYSHLTSRFEIRVGVSYSADMAQVVPLLKQIALDHKAVSRKPEPSIRLTRFDDSAIEITIMFWCSEVFRVESVKSEIRFNIFKAFSEHHIEFPYPQRVIHMKPPFEK